MLEWRDFLRIDFVVGSVALLWAVSATYFAFLAGLMAPDVAFASALTALSLWVGRERAELEGAK